MPGKSATPDEFMAALAHPKRAEAEALRKIIRGLKAPRFEEGIKWNAPSYSLGGVHYLTFNFGDLKSVRLIFHCDTARKENKGGPPLIADETGLLVFQSDIRALAAFGGMEEVTVAEKKLPGLVKRWIEAAQA
ncbi:hypothetical protein HPO_14761 [Hyphomonas polymorpha PS728]|uniref:YdhG-like domain-containing protein n=2 Tax=Hyphomonas polymorpha TaxID=74319 RepID=A0A062V610_9PROT|nr:hypothetical protein HPO_14761 [Hyphomonas polymorpha PS728]